MSAAMTLFRAIVGAELATAHLEIRHRQPDGKSWAQRFFAVDRLEHAATYALRAGSVLDTFVGMAPRVRASGKNDAVERAWILSADCDGDSALDALAGFAPTPSILIASGGLTETARPRLHAHWILHEPVDRAALRGAKAKLAQALGADPRIADAARILRVPGTYNFKDGGRQPVKCIVFDAQATYTAREVVGAIPDPAPLRVPCCTERSADDPLLSLPAATYIEALTGRTPSGRNYVRCPFHRGGQERRPDLKLYGTTWACFACEGPGPNGKLGGTIYTFAGRLWGYPLPLRGPAFLAVQERLYDVMIEHLSGKAA